MATNSEKINVELPGGITVKVPSDRWYAMSDEEIENFYLQQKTSFDYHQEITDPFDNSVIQIETIPDLEYDDDLEIDTSIDWEFSED